MVNVRAKGVGFAQLDKNFRKIAHAVVDPQAGIAEDMDDALNETVIPQIQKNIWANFDTTGTFPSYVGTKKVNQFRVDVGVFVVYAAIQEYGGTVKVTDRARGYFWYRWYASGQSEGMWKALALSQSYTIPARPYFRPALERKQLDAVKRTAVLLADRIEKAVR